MISLFLGYKVWVNLPNKPMLNKISNERGIVWFK
jgi:hypothetical protein